jgi:8-oxo-dGTP pyrophosphatase MutT (NUDIX family)
VLLRDGPEGLETLLLKRSPRAGFIPGAWVFPGGTLDSSDSDPALLQRIDGLTRREAQQRFGEHRSTPPAFAYWVAALREAFEETGILPGAGPAESRPKDSHRSRLLSGEAGFLQILDELDVTLDARAMEYSGHWVTPTCEPRRYETRFFAIAVEADTEVDPHEKEMVEALWASPGEALARNEEGRLPLVFPTLLTLEGLEPFASVAEALAALRGKSVRRRLPKPELHADGIRFVLPEFQE